MTFKDDKAVMAMLFRNPDTMKSLHRTFSTFCQWCGDERTPNPYRNSRTPRTHVRRMRRR